MSEFKEMRENFERDGYSIVRSVFAKEEVDYIREQAYETIRTSAGKSNLQKKGESPSLLFWPGNLNRSLRNYAEDPRLQWIVRYFLGDDVLQLNNQIYFREAGDVLAVGVEEFAEADPVMG